MTKLERTVIFDEAERLKAISNDIEKSMVDVEYCQYAELCNLIMLLGLGESYERYLRKTEKGIDNE